VKQLGIIAALPAEAKCLAGATDNNGSPSSPLQLSDNVFLIISGIGAEQAAIASTTLIEYGADALLSWGCAGALCSSLHAGDLLLPQMIKPHASESLHTNQAWHTHLYNILSDTCNPVTGALADSAHIITEPTQKQDLYQSSGAVAVDMESVAIAMLAQDAHIPFMAIRAIADDAESHLPAYISRSIDAYGNIKLARMTGLLLTHPASWLRLIRLGQQFSAAKSTLSLVTETIGIDSLLPPTLSSD